MLCGDLNGKEIQNRGDICIRIADSLCCIVETMCLPTLDVSHVFVKYRRISDWGINLNLYIFIGISSLFFKLWWPNYLQDL